MPLFSTPLLQQSNASRKAHPAVQSAAQAAAYWVLPQGQAISLTPREPGRLRVAQGRVWMTTEAQPGDWVLGAGDAWCVQVGQRLVIEPLQAAGVPAPRLAWEPLAQTCATPSSAWRVVPVVPHLRRLARRIIRAWPGPSLQPTS